MDHYNEQKKNIEGSLMRTEHLCAKEFKIFSHYDIFSLLYPQTISEQCKQRT